MKCNKNKIRGGARAVKGVGLKTLIGKKPDGLVPSGVQIPSAALKVCFYFCNSKYYKLSILILKVW